MSLPAESDTPESTPKRAAWWPLLPLGLLYLFGVVGQQPVAWFGHYHDDTLYLASAHALAEEGAYTLPSLPMEPAQTKYPILYPALLALGLDIAGGDNVVDAGVRAGVIWNCLAGLVLLWASWRLAGQLGFRPVLRWAVPALIAIHPVVVHLSAQLLSELVFAALLVSALGQAESDLDAGKRRAPWRSALLLALAVATRTAGLAAVVGLALAAWLRGRRTAAVTWCAAAGAVFVAHQLWALTAGWKPGLGDAAGWVQTMTFYTSYIRFWLISVGDVTTFLAQLQFNVSEALKAPAVLLFHMPIQGFEGAWLQALGVMLSLGTVKGLWPVWKTMRHPAIAALATYWPIVLIWNFPLAERLMFPWLALLLCGALREGQGAVAAALQAFRDRRPVADRIASAVVLLALAALIGYAARWGLSRSSTLAAAADVKAAQQEARALVWSRLRAELPADAVVISYDDAEVYLRTGRHAIRPIVFRTSAFYRQSQAILDEDLSRLSDVAAASSADVWLTLAEDFRLETGRDEIVAQTAEWLRGHAVPRPGLEAPAALHELVSSGTGVVASRP